MAHGRVYYLDLSEFSLLTFNEMIKTIFILIILKFVSSASPSPLNSRLTYLVKYNWYLMCPLGGLVQHSKINMLKTDLYLTSYQWSLLCHHLSNENSVFWIESQKAHCYSQLLHFSHTLPLQILLALFSKLILNLTTSHHSQSQSKHWMHGLLSQSAN